ncbi:MAG: glutathione S-transferase family protein, partial [Hyphomicrobiaceae bacterium]
ITKMRLLWSSRSPFVRKVLIAAHELGLGDRIELVSAFVTGKIPVPDVEALNPIGQIPTLVDVDGATVFDSTAIIDYLDTKFGSGLLLPRTYPQRLDVLRRVALAQGIKEKSIRWISERLRPEEHRDTELITGITRTLNNCLDSLETDAARWKDMPIDAGHVGLAAALGYLDFRFAQVSWRTRRPALETWHKTFAQRPSYIATEFVDPNKVAQPNTKP